MERKHFVSIIIVNYNGRDLLGDCLNSIKHINYPKDLYEVIVVDNNSTDDSVSFVHKNFPEHYLVRNEENLGFAGGNKVGLRYANGEYIVLLNTDTKVDVNWLNALVDAADNPRVGIVNSKLYLATPFIYLDLHVSTIEKTMVDGSGDLSPIGVNLEDVICEKQELSDLVWYGDGFYKDAKAGIACRWTRGNAQIVVPFDLTRNENTYRLTMHTPKLDKAKKFEYELKLGDLELASGVLKSEQVVHLSVKLPRKKITTQLKWMVQNAGNVVFSNGFGRDRGSLVSRVEEKTKEFYEIDSEFYRKPSKLLAFCGASCLIKRKLIEQVGFFDEKYYMYYEDLDLSLRAWAAGWNIVFEPKSLVFHRHKASTSLIKGAFMLQHVEKNHLYFLLTYFSLKLFAIEFIFLIIRTIGTYLQMQMFLFRDNILTYEYLRQRYIARKEAVKSVFKEFNYFLSKRNKIVYKRQNAKLVMQQMMF